MGQIEIQNLLFQKLKFWTTRSYTFSSDFHHHKKINLLIIPIFNSTDFQVLQFIIIN